MAKKSHTKPAYLREVSIKYSKRRVKDGSPVDQTIADAGEVAALFKDLEDEAKEKLIAICLDAKLKIICFEVVAIGTVSGVYTRKAEVLRAPIALNAHNLIVVHNHPSGDPTPGIDDKRFTKNLKTYTHDLGIEFCDHIIIGKGAYYSFAEEGLLWLPRAGHGELGFHFRFRGRTETGCSSRPVTFEHLRLTI